MQCLLKGSYSACFRLVRSDQYISGKKPIYCSNIKLCFRLFQFYLFVQRNEAQLYEDMNRLKQENQFLVADLQLMRKERVIVKAPAASDTGKTEYTMELES